MSGSVGQALQDAVPALDETLQAATDDTVVWVLLTYHQGHVRMACNAPRDVAGELVRSVHTSWDDQVEMPSFKEH